MAKDWQGQVACFLELQDDRAGLSDAVWARCSAQ